MSAFELAATGATLNVWIPIIAGILLVGGIAAIVIGRLRRPKNDAVQPTTPTTAEEPGNEDRTV